jgi:pimeloyl-ACP methyl ester carboxylesterase
MISASWASTALMMAQKAAAADNRAHRQRKEYRMRVQRLILTLCVASFAGCATARPPVNPASAGGDVVSAKLDIGGTVYDVDWFIPSGEAAALVTVQHGFSRHCDNVRGAGERFLASGLMGLCVNASMAGGNPQLAEALAVTLLSGISAPGGRALPDKIIVGGHSAGAHFASRLGWKLAALAPQRLLGALLFDPVAAGGFSDNLMVVSAVGQRPVYAVTSNPGACNAQNNAYPALRQVQRDARGAGRDGFVGLQLTDRSTHVDVEGSDTDLLAVFACRQGAPRPPNTEVLRTLAAQWADDIAAGTRQPDDYPGGRFVDGLIEAGRAAVIE